MCLWASTMFAQAGGMLLDQSAQFALERAVFERDSGSHSAVWPFRQNEMREVFAAADSSSAGASSLFNPAIGGSLGGKWRGGLSPIFDLGAGVSSERGALYNASGGAQAALHYNKKWTLYAEIFGGVERAPGYIADFADSLGVVPGLGRNRGNGDQMAFLLPTFALSYSPSKYFQIDAGLGTNRFGSGYRSLLLSDAAYNYPYLKITTDVWHFKYTNLFAALTHIGDEAVRRDNFQPKYSASHYLSWAVSRRVTFSIFESIVWQGRDTLSDRGFDVHYLNPVIFYRPVEFAVGSPDRVLVGADLQVRLGTKAAVYGQFTLDEFLLENLRERNGWWANKWGIQIGAKVYDIFGIAGLRAQAEYNVVRPFTYSHGSVVQNYAHFNQPLAHPLGSNFYEGLLLLNYENGDWFAGSHTVAARYGRDDGANTGGNLFRSYANPEMIFGNTIAQGLQHDVLFQRFSVGRIINERLNLRLSVRYTMRAEQVGGSTAGIEHFAGLHLATGFYNRQRDF